MNIQSPLRAHFHCETAARVERREAAAAAAAVAAANAAAVDDDARFPAEAIAAAREGRLLSPLIPTSLGGDGATVSDVVDVCYGLGRACAATGMIYAMHQIMVACLVRHAAKEAWSRELQRRIAAEQLLLASSTTDGKGGGDLRNSSCAVTRQGSGVALTKSATVMSYGAQADAILTTARRSPEAAPSDQVLLAVTKEQYTLEHLVDWDTLGMRGTCSAGFTLRTSIDTDQVFAEPYQQINARTVLPVAHLTWSGVWAGIAAGAVERARGFVRGVARKSSGQLPPGAAHLTRASATLGALRGMIASALQRYEALALHSEQLESLDFQNAMNLLKVNASEMAIATVMSALQASGLSGYRNDGASSIGRHLRDVLSSSIMINNDRILANAATATLLTEVPIWLRD
jgi:acyl-CoA dehydrogenase